ncbi:hypothetical protein Tco_0121045 [Tanacetum coccineum]
MFSHIIPESIMMFGQNSSSLSSINDVLTKQSSLVLLIMMSAQISSGLAPQCLKMFKHSSSSLGLHCQKTFKQISSNLISQMSQRRLLASLQAPLEKETFSDLQKLQNELLTFRISVDIRQNTNFVRAFTTSANVWKATGKLFANVGYQWRPTGKKFTLGKLNCGYQWRPTGKKFTLGKLNCGYQWRPTGKKFALGELCPLTRFSVTCCSKLDLEEWMAPVRISSGPVPIMTLVLSSSSLVLHQMMFVQISSNLASQMSQRRLLASLQAPFLKDKKVVKWINVDQLIGKGNLLLDLQKLQKNPIFRISVDICQNTNYFRAFTTSANVPSIYILLFWNTLTHDAKTGVYSFQVDEHWLTLSADLLRKALNRWIIASQDETTGPSVHPEDATSTKMVRETLSHADAEFGGNSEKINSETDTEILNVGDEQG